MAEPNKSPSQPIPRLKEVGGYEILSKLGQGGMGAVFKARQKSLDRTVALKILPPTIARDNVFIERFQREARATAKLNHPNIVQGIDVGKDEASGLWYFAMEYVDGPSLQKMLKDQKVIPEKRALEITRDIARALECASHNGFVHRDIKPDNILLTQRGEAKLADLGLAKQLSDDASLTQSGQSVGTPHYMAPEQARGAMNEIDIRTDIYALGGTLFHLVTGRTPFAGSSNDTSAVIMTRHLTEPVPRAKSVNPEISDTCSKLISRMLQKKREQRVQTPAALIEQIEEILNGDAPASEVVARRSRQDTTGPRTPVGRAAPVQGDRRSPVPMVVAGLIAVGILGFVLARPKPAPERTAEAAPPANETPAAAINKPPAEPPKVASPAPPANPAAPDAPTAAAPSPPAPPPEPVRPTAAPPPAENPEEIARQAMAMLKAAEQAGKLSAADLRTAYSLVARKFESTAAGKEALEKEKALAAVESAPKPTPAEAQAKPAAAANAVDEKAIKTAELFAAVLKEEAPLLAQNKFADAISLLDQKISNPSFADARDLLKQEKADIQAIQDLRRLAIDALRKIAGKTVSLKRGNSAINGTISSEARTDQVIVKVSNGPELTMSSTMLHVQDVDTHAPNAGPEDLRRRGLLYLAAGDKDSLVKARVNFILARDAGLNVENYLERITILELGELEFAAGKAWKKAEALFEEKRLDEANEAYTAFSEKFAKTKLMEKNAELLAARLKAIAKAGKPEVTFRENESMKMFPEGHRAGPFPAQGAPDPLAPFDNKPAYFNQRSGTDVVYDVRFGKPLKSLRWKGAAMQNMTIEILDPKGTVLTTGGPYNGGNKWAEFNVDFEPRKEFTIRLRNHISHWYFVNEIELK